MNENVVTKIKAKCKEIEENYFENSKLEGILKSSEILLDPRDIFNKLSLISLKMQKIESVEESLIREAFDILLDEKLKITFFELEKTNIILNISRYLDSVYYTNLQSNSESYNSVPDVSFLKRIRMIFSLFKENPNKINQLINLLQYSISSMNCFKLSLYDYENYKNIGGILLQGLNDKNTKLFKVKYSYHANQSSIKFSNEKAKDLHQFYSSKTNLTCMIDPYEKFSQMNEVILTKNNPNSNFPGLLTKDPYKMINKEIMENFLASQSSNTEIKEELFEEKKSQVVNPLEKQNSQLKSSEEDSLSSDSFMIHFFLVIEESKISIHPNWNMSQLAKQVKSIFPLYSGNLSDQTIFFEFLGNQEYKAIFENSNQEESTTQKEQVHMISISKGEERFLSYYSSHVVGNPALYNIKRASPFMYLIILAEIGFNKFGSTFDLNYEINQASLENQKISSLLMKQVRDPYAIAYNTVPSWCQEISQNYPFFSNFNSRFLMFKTCSFDKRRSMMNLAIFVKNYLGEGLVDEKSIISASKRKKIKINREDIINCTDKLYNDFKFFNGYLEFEYLNEVGTGNGPTLEFYSIFVERVKSYKDLWYNTSDKSLFPLPTVSASEENLKVFTLIGFVIARAIYDDRLVDFPINSVFWDLLLGRPISIKNLQKIDVSLYKGISEFLVLKDKIEKNKQDKVNLHKEGKTPIS